MLKLGKFSPEAKDDIAEGGCPPDWPGAPLDEALELADALPCDPLAPADEGLVAWPRLPMRSPAEVEPEDNWGPVAACSGVGGRPGSEGEPDPETAFQARGGGESEGEPAEDDGIPEIVAEPDAGGFPPFAERDEPVEPARPPLDPA